MSERPPTGFSFPGVPHNPQPRQHMESSIGSAASPAERPPVLKKRRRPKRPPCPPAAERAPAPLLIEPLVKREVPLR